MYMCRILQKKGYVRSMFHKNVCKPIKMSHEKGVGKADGERRILEVDENLENAANKMTKKFGLFCCCNTFFRKTERCKLQPVEITSQCHLTSILIAIQRKISNIQKNINWLPLNVEKR